MVYILSLDACLGINGICVFVILGFGCDYLFSNI